MAIYVAMASALIVWLLVFGYLLRLDRQARELRRMLERAEATGSPDAPRVSVESRTNRPEGGAGDADPQRRDEMKSATSL